MGQIMWQHNMYYTCIHTDHSLRVKYDSYSDTAMYRTCQLVYWTSKPIVLSCTPTSGSVDPIPLCQSKLYICSALTWVLTLMINLSTHRCRHMPQMCAADDTGENKQDGPPCCTHIYTQPFRQVPANYVTTQSIKVVVLLYYRNY